MCSFTVFGGFGLDGVCLGHGFVAAFGRRIARYCCVGGIATAAAAAAATAAALALGIDLLAVFSIARLSGGEGVILGLLSEGLGANLLLADGRRSGSRFP